MINKKITIHNGRKNMSALASANQNNEGESKGQTQPTAELGECEICWNTFNKSSRQKITCGKCEMQFCKQCVRKYLIESNDSAHCMNCKVAWDRKFTQESLNKSFFDKEYKQHRKNLLFESEKARFMETMPYVEDHKNLKKFKQNLDSKNIEIAKLELILSDLRREAYNINCEIRRINVGELAGHSEKRKFIRKCPADGCEGYLSTQWKCGSCGVWVCPDCFEVKGYNKDEEHTCNEEAKATAQMIKDETKPCPDCGIRIFKVSGCDQMWCTSCHVAFSWATGRKVHGVIHNPHFYEYQRNNNANVANPGMMACGGIPTYNNFRNAIRIVEWRWRKYLDMYTNSNSGNKKFLEITNMMWCDFPECIKYYVKNVYLYEKENKSDEKYISFIESAPRGVCNSLLRSITTLLWTLHRGAQHLQHTILARLRTRQQNMIGNRDLRVRFLCNELDEKQMKTTLMTRDTAHQKRQEILNIYELMAAVNNEILTHFLNMTQNRDFLIIVEDFDTNQLVQDKLKEFCKSLCDDLSRMERVRQYCNVELCKISVNYGQKVQIIAFDRTTPSIDKKRAKQELLKDVNNQGKFMNKFVNGTTRFQHAQKDNIHLME